MNLFYLSNTKQSLILFLGLCVLVQTIRAQGIADVSQQQPVTKDVAIDSVGTLQSKTEVEVVVVGYGTQKKTNVTSSIASVKNDEFKDQPVSNLVSSLQGKITGINVTTPSGTPGAGLLVSVRGSSNPLYVIDGVPMLSESNSQIGTSFDANGNSVGSGQNLSSIADLNPNDIESIDVLKDASAASIYGARSANGVVLITTKKGKAGKTSYSVNYYNGVQMLRKSLPLMNAQQLYSYLQKAHNNDKAAWAKLSNDADKEKWIANSLLVGTSIEDIEKLLGTTGELNFNAYVIDDPNNPSDEYPYKKVTWSDAINQGYNYDWQKEVFRYAQIQNVEISAKGGNEKGKFYVSGSYYNQDGIIVENNFKRFSFKLNTEYALNKALKLGANITLTNTQNRRTFNDNTYSGVLTNAIPSSPLMPFYNTYDLANGRYFAYGYGTGAYLTDNPVKTAREIYGFTTGNRGFGNVYLDWKIIDPLKFKTNVSVDFSNTEDVLNLSNITTDASAVGGKGSQGTNRNITILNENTLDFSKSFENHNVSILLGQSIQKSSSNTLLINSIGYLRASNNYSNSNAALTTSGLGTGDISWFVASFFGRVNYDYDGKYLVSFSLRADGSSRFASNNRWGIFPAISLGWNMVKEKFMANNTVLTGLKLRASVGTAGDQDIALYRYLNYYTPSGYNSNIAYSPGLLADPSITWQKNTTFNIGIDYDLWKGKISGGIDFYIANRTDILIPVPTSGVTGTSTIIKNGGTVRDQGIELSLNYLAIKNKDWKLNFNANINFVKNEVTDIPVDNQLQSTYTDVRPSHIIKKGYSLGSFWGIKAAGFDNDGNALFYNSNGEKVFYSEINYDKDATVIGKARPDFFGGFGIDASWKNFDLSIDFTYSYGNQVYNIFRAVYDNGGYQKLSAPSYDATTGWVLAQVTSNYLVEGTNPGPNASLLKRNYIENSSTYVEDASFLRCKNINLGYTFKFNPNGKLNFIQNIRIYAQAQNLFVFSPYSGYDPEVSANGGANPYTAGVDYATFPLPRTFTLGFNINFQ